MKIKKFVWILLGIILVEIVFWQNSESCYAINKTSCGKYYMEDATVEMEVGINGPTYWVKGESNELCDYEVNGEYIGEDGNIAFRFSAHQRDYCYMEKTLPYDILYVYVDFCVYANNGDYIENHLAVY